jgi:hypothetical protein
MTFTARRFLIAIIVFAGSLAVGATVASAQPVGYVAAIEGSALIWRAEQSEPASEGSIVQAQDRLETGPDSRVLLVLEDGSRIVIGADTQITILFLVDAGVVSGDQVIELLQGILRIGVHQPNGRALLETRSPTAVVAARSTEWIIEYADDSTAVLGLDGTVEVSATTATGSVVLGPGFGTDVARGAAPTDPVEWGAARAQSARERTAFGAIR